MRLNSAGPLFNKKPEPDLRHRILNTFLLLLAFRVLGGIPVLNVDPARLQHVLANNPSLGLIDLLAGGDVLTHFSVAAAGLLPFLVALILARILTWTVPQLREFRQRGAKGQKAIDLIAQILTVPLAFLFALAISKYLAIQTGLFPGGIKWFTAASFLPSLWVVVLVTAGSLMTAWLTDRITSTGIGRGENVVLWISACLTLAKPFAASRGGFWPRLALVLAGGTVLIVLIYQLTKAQRRVPVNSPKRQAPGRPGQMLDDPPSIPFGLNAGGVLPISAALGFVTLAQLGVAFLASRFGQEHGGQGGMPGWAWAMFTLLIMIFVAFYNWALISGANTLDGEPVWARLQKSGDYIPGFRPGRATQAYLTWLMARLSLLGATGTALLAAGVPYLVYRLTQQNIIAPVLSVFLLVHTFDQLRGEVLTHKLKESYSGLIKRARRKAR